MTAVDPESPSRTAPASLLSTTPGTTALSATAPPSSSAARPAACAEATSRLATSGMPQQPSSRSTSPGGSQPRPAATIVAAVAMSASAASNGGSGGAARRRACRTACTSARTAYSGVVKGGTAPVSSAAGVSAPSQTASTGRSAPSAAAAIARATSAARAASGRTKIVTTASTASSASRIRSERSYWSAVAEAIMFTGLPVEASGARPSASRARVAADGGSIRRPAASQASAQRVPGPPALVSTATRSPRGSG